MNKTQVAEDLRAAARYIEEHGLAQGIAETETGKVCTLGALAKVTGVDTRVAYDMSLSGPRFAACAAELSNWLRRELGSRGRIPVWNDCTCKDASDVIAGLEKAAAWVEEQA